MGRAVIERESRHPMQDALDSMEVHAGLKHAYDDSGLPQGVLREIRRVYSNATPTDLVNLAEYIKDQDIDVRHITDYPNIYWAMKSRMNKSLDHGGWRPSSHRAASRRRM